MNPPGTKGFHIRYQAGQPTSFSRINFNNPPVYQQDDFAVTDEGFFFWQESEWREWRNEGLLADLVLELVRSL